MLISRQNQKLIQQHNPPDRRLYLFFSGRNRQNRAPIRQTTVSFFSGRNVSFFFPVVMKISRHNKKTANFPPTDDCIFFFYGRNRNFTPLQKTIQQHNPPDRRLYLFFSFVCNRQNRAPNRQTTVSFFFPVVMYIFFRS